MDIWQWIKSLNSQTSEYFPLITKIQMDLCYYFHNKSSQCLSLISNSFLSFFFRFRVCCVMFFFEEQERKEFSRKEVLFSYVLYLDKELQELWQVTVNHIEFYYCLFIIFPFISVTSPLHPWIHVNMWMEFVFRSLFYVQFRSRQKRMRRTKKWQKKFRNHVDAPKLIPNETWLCT